MFECIINFLYIYRPYELRKIMNTNLILLVVHGVCPESTKTPENADTVSQESKTSENFDTVPQEIIYPNGSSLNCHKASNGLPRCRPKTACIRTHPDVSKNLPMIVVQEM